MRFFAQTRLTTYPQYTYLNVNILPADAQTYTDLKRPNVVIYEHYKLLESGPLVFLAVRNIFQE